MNSDLISREALKEVIRNDRQLEYLDNWTANHIFCLIDNTPTTTSYTLEDLEVANDEKYATGAYDVISAYNKGMVDAYRQILKDLTDRSAET